MIIKEVHVKNFRSILEETLPCDCLTALVGRNGAGKSSFLRAIEMFYDPSSKITSEDFYAEDTSQDIEIAITFSNLTAEERGFFSRHIDKDSLTVVRVFSVAPGRKSGTYHGMPLQNPEFTDVRNAGGKRDITATYKELRSTDKYSSLPTKRSAEQALEALGQWEREHPGECSRLRDEGQFFGFTQVGQGYLGRHTRFIRVPAVRDASDDATEGRGSCVTEIMDLVIRNVLARRKDLTVFKEETQQRYNDILDPSKLVELTTLQSQLTNTLKQYAPDTSVSLLWSELADINIPLPQAQVKLLEDGYEATVQRTGHGLQRAFILTMLQHLVAAREIDTATEEGFASEEEIPKPQEPHLPNLVLAIEEPELYQHPSRQRHMASVLLDLAQGSIPGVAQKTQVIYSTHAPLYVGLDRFEQVRVLRKRVGGEGNPKVTGVTRTTWDAIAEQLWNADDKRRPKFTADTLRPRLQAIMTPWMNEGFFADAVVLVEGEGDRAAVLGVAASMGQDLESQGVAVIPCMGKSNLDRPYLIFRHLRIPTYVVWDSDKGARDPKPEQNRRLLRLLGVEEQEWPSIVTAGFACFESTLEKRLREELGETIFDAALQKAQEDLGILKKEQALKNPVVIRRIVEAGRAQGRSSQTLERILERIRALKLASAEA